MSQNIGQTSNFYIHLSPEATMMENNTNDTTRIQRHSPKANVRRKRTRPPPSSFSPKTALRIAALPLFASGYTVTWNFGPEGVCVFMCVYSHLASNEISIKLPS